MWWFLFPFQNAVVGMGIDPAVVEILSPENDHYSYSGPIFAEYRAQRLCNLGRTYFAVPSDRILAQLSYCLLDWKMISETTEERVL